MTASKFMALQAVVRPDWFQSMADGETVQEDTSKKRVRKSVDRTLAFLDECLQLQQKSQVLETITYTILLSNKNGRTKICIFP